PDGVPTLRFLQCRWWDRMGREHDVGRVSVGAVDSEYQLAYPHRGAGRDRAVADSGRRGAAARTPAPAQLAMNTALAVIGPLPLPVGLWLGRRFGDAAYLAVRRRRQIALDTLAVAYPALPLRDRARLARHASQHLGMTLIELARVLTRPLEDTLARIRLEG